MNIEEIKQFADTIRHCGDYGELWVNEGVGGVYWVCGDADGPEAEENHTDFDDIENGFLAIEGVKTVEIEAECGPYNKEGWVCLGWHGIEMYQGKEYPMKNR